MCNWKKWIWPGILSVVILTALANWFRGDVIENDLSAKATQALSENHPWASVELDRRDLTLKGMAPSPEAAADALTLADNAYDVRIVKDGTEALAAADPYKLNIAKSADGIVLTGFAPDDQTRDAIAEATKKASGGLNVDNQLKLASKAPSGFAGLAEYAAGFLPSLSTGEADLTANGFSVSGVAKTLEEFGNANSLVDQLPSGFELSNNGILPPAVSPYRWSVSKRANTVTLRGNVPTEEARAAAVAKATSTYAGASVDDRMVLASGDPQSSDAVRDALSGLVARLDAGEGNMVDRAVSISGRVGDQAVADAIDAELRGSVPDNYTVSTNITVPKPLPKSSDEEEGIAVTPQAVVEEQPALAVADPFVWSVAKSDNGISVAGNVSSEEIQSANIEMAKTRFSVADVADEQTLALGAPDRVGEVRDFMMRQVRFFETGSANLSGDTVTFKGDVKNKNVAGLVQRAVENRMPSGFKGVVDLSFPEAEKVVATAVVVKPPVANPFRWSVSKLPSGVTVLGNVASEAVGTANIDQIKSRLNVSEVDDRQTVARGAPNKLSDVRELLINQVKLLEAGQGNVVGQSVSVTGKAKNENIRNLINRTVTTKLPEGFTGSTNIVFPKSDVIKGITPEFKEDEEEQAAVICQQNIINAVNGRKIQFETARAIIRPVSRPVLDDVVKVALECPDVRFVIGGHTDSRGRDAYNQELSEARANAVVQYMSKAGIDAARLEARGFGETTPIGDNETVEGRAQNRRIEFRVIQ